MVVIVAALTRAFVPDCSRWYRRCAASIV